MDYPYDIQALSSKCKVSKASIYNLIKKNQEFVKQNSTKIKNEKTNSKPKVMYNQAVLDLFLEYYNLRPGGDTTAPVADALRGNADGCYTAPAESEGSNTAANENATITALEKKIAVLEEQINELLKQNGHLLLLLSQEKAEKQQLLPAPKKTFRERFRSLFSNE